MGTYLSTPVTDKCEESGESMECPEVPCSWGVVDMQGWRKSMEDAHLAVTDLPLPGVEESAIKSDAKVFGVFDGHGGPEVARFSALYLVSVLTQQSTWKEGIIEAPVAPEGEAADSMVGQALRSTFHALDRMINDQDRREEIINLRNLKPTSGERRDAVSIPDVACTASNPTGIVIEEPAEPKADPAEGKADDAKPAADDEGGEQATEEREADADDEKDDDSTEAAGKEEAAEQDRDMMDDGEKSESIEPVDPSNAGKVTSMFQKILSLGGGSTSGQVVVKVDEDDATGQAASSPHSQPIGPSAAHPTILQNGRMICNLPDHPIHAGATAIVAVITGRTLTVANAGDSRAVLCRKGGETLPLSFDHKPQQEREMTRISNAGGFVNHFGRVNGNLNLSRSIGDLKYKQVPNIAPEDQMITAEPDIVQITLEPDDEFIILGCDGIWDCLTNETAVKYVRERIDEKLPTEIGAEMLDTIISDDPRVTQGIGGDNMTVMIIDLQTASRKSRQKETESGPEDPADSAEPAE
mmetsp:Transcript_113467/g.169738  ORF Transcript_113467/g.169738 Transcript_113467/m.169738 type:complete len:526 (-) Transcript_113467:28-1605(-)|eukprot:CAMPEP_0117009422 /NCGR_PEP_ID=MMETSP0472-20121206/8564_1 /TAXON_ID=693140 ORGANISM="Tiarina fusus, Strain LIS" /NCGR_SAMPLE_ID=MMETSP0472 /ASSEMBLY_ACC=CAM_ASM_000603 /LENGTH=525 /DNA_ID=CAMNT_0004711699 /DNA_START=226 /DNA_END=1803 /DNA_ORIENTATION=+